MNSKLASVLALGFVLVWLVNGCESTRTKPSGVTGRVERRVLTPERRLTVEEILTRAAAVPPARIEGDDWQPLFDGKSLAGWEEIKFAGAGEVTVDRGMILCWMGEPFTGLKAVRQIPKVNYEVSLEAMRVTGSDFFCGLTFPVRDSFCSMIVGGWGGGLVGLSSLDDMDASENETMKVVSFEDGRWYRIRLRVTEQRIEAWIEQKKAVDVVISGRKISLRPGEIERSMPFGLTSWMTSAAFREIRIRPVEGPADPVRW